MNNSIATNIIKTMPNVASRSSTPISMNIRRARLTEESWETACETLILFIGTLKDTDLHHENNIFEMFADIEEIMCDLPSRREWTQLYLFKLCSMSTLGTSLLNGLPTDCPVKKRIKIAANGWKTVCESFYVISDLAKDVVPDDPESIIEFKNSIRQIFTEERLWAMQDGAPFEFVVDGYDDNWDIVPVAEADTECEDEDEVETDTDEEGEEKTDDEDELDETDEEDTEDDEMPALIDVEESMEEDFDFLNIM